MTRANDNSICVLSRWFRSSKIRIDGGRPPMWAKKMSEEIPRFVRASFPEVHHEEGFGLGDANRPRHRGLAKPAATYDNARAKVSEGVSHCGLDSTSCNYPLRGGKCGTVNYPVCICDGKRIAGAQWAAKGSCQPRGKSGQKRLQIPAALKCVSRHRSCHRVQRA